jgi:hypothetical protein
MIPCKPVDDERDAFSVHDYVKTARSTSQCLAITAQHCCSIEFDENLLVRDGISETAA